MPSTRQRRSLTVEEVISSAPKFPPPFNSPLETGIRSVAILVEAYPNSFDLQHLVAFDYLVVHTGDIGGPQSLHPELPLRSTELLVRRGLVERGLLLMISRNLVQREALPHGIYYRAGEFAETFLDSLTSPYLRALRERATWVGTTFGTMEQDTFRQTLRTAFGQWIEEFQSVERSVVGER
ncbi:MULTISPECIES: ABC-three component system middle component 2 [unclassified Bradyrhizobium]|uniref:ABC-three component system middle component 2 n=1 Tax=unclassified Bradyrhizobium TaxID=2631580 RepID=UPI0028E3AD7A|nr:MULTISPECIES: ABC-three component system middle component 2 [unclassified Bradyrhizobium]